jgi:hypothetical protein
MLARHGGASMMPQWKLTFLNRLQLAKVLLLYIAEEGFHLPDNGMGPNW